MPERIRIRFENHSTPIGNTEKPTLLNRKPCKKRRIREKIFNFFRFLMKASGKSHSAENPKSTLCSQKVSLLVKIEGGFNENKFLKSLEKTPVFKKNKIRI